MYNGIGLQTARGSGTNGHVQRNWAFVRPGKKDNIAYKTEEDLSKLDASMNRPPNQEILDHERKRKIEVKCAEFEEILEKQGYTYQEIKAKVDSYRAKLMGQGKGELPKDEFGRIIVRETHQIAEAQQEKNAKLREAFGIPEYFVDGSSFDPDRKAKEEIAKSTSLQKELQSQKDFDKEKARQYALIRSPSKEKEVVEPIKGTTRVDEKRKKKKKLRDRSLSNERKKDKKKKSKKHKRDRSKKKKSKKEKEPDSCTSENESDDSDNTASGKDIKKKKKSKKEKKKKDRKRKTRDTSIESAVSDLERKRRRLASTRTSREREKRETCNRNRDNINYTKSDDSRKCLYNKNEDNVISKKVSSKLKNIVPEQKTQKHTSSLMHSNHKKRSARKKSRTPQERRSTTPKLHKGSYFATSGKSSLHVPSFEECEDLRQSYKKQQSKCARLDDKDKSLRSRISDRRESRSRSHSASRTNRRGLDKEPEKELLNEGYSKQQTTLIDKYSSEKTKYVTEYKNPFKRRNSRGGDAERRRKSRSPSEFKKRERSYSCSPNNPETKYHQSQVSSRRIQKPCSTLSPEPKISKTKLNSRSSPKNAPSDHKCSAKSSKPQLYRRSRSHDSSKNSKRKDKNSEKGSIHNVENSPKHLLDAKKQKKRDSNNEKTSYSPHLDKKRRNIPSSSQTSNIREKDLAKENSIWSHKKEEVKSPKRSKPHNEGTDYTKKDKCWTQSHKPIGPSSPKCQKSSDVKYDSSSSELSYSPARRNPERYRDILEQIGTEKTVFKSYQKNKTLSPPPPDIPVRQESKVSIHSKETKKMYHPPQPIVRLHSSTDSEDDSDADNEERKRNVDKFVDAVVNDKDEEQRLKEFELLEALKSDIAAKAKEKIKTIEKMASEINDPLPMISSITENVTADSISESMMSSLGPKNDAGRSLSNFPIGEKTTFRKSSRSSYSSSSRSSSGSSISRSDSSLSSRSCQSSGSESSSSSSRRSQSRSRTASRSPSIPRRRGSPSFLDRRRITSKSNYRR
uniref:Putative splicing coactivator srm160/300 subunit n=1 Tax=Tabanus bromius TaxID=304241 RepID=A0A0K8TS33_TABBR